ncbi:glycoside hydrolase family 79 protein [Epithele typhae]|uniref:glycoside hydrolase family 79 protein n=1 Tax=Epithele typhae TaxID=378194 RepID=UPI0020086326|nr:glycoside hydrolase family 79 protein [Epithele typhae]KAH9933993.1 glycoside hydrolase family 79 protein [Epithele typhae]
MPRPLLCLAALGLLATSASADITIYGQLGQTTINLSAATAAAALGTSTAPATTSFVTTPGPPQYTGLAAYNPVIYQAPAIPNPAPANAFSIGVAHAASNVNALSIPQSGTFLGFSIELSVATQLSTCLTNINVPFLNLISLLVERAGAIHIRVGGNSQEDAFLVDNLSDGRILEKGPINPNVPTSTPVVMWTPDLIYMLGNISSLTNAKWYLGVPFNDTNFRFQMAEISQAVLGDRLLGLQAGNEPDLYGSHLARQQGYSQFDYYGEFGLLTQAFQADSNVPVKKSLIAPSVQGADWGPNPEAVWNTGFVAAYDAYLAFLSVEHYPSDNCAVLFPDPNNKPKDPLALLPTYLTHQAGLNLVSTYLNSTMFAQTVNKPFLMFETNTASCGGFPGISDAFTSALWGVDYGLQMAHSNFSGALFHFGGQNVSYNPFIPPPTNESHVHQWTAGPLFYSTLVVAEALGTSNTSRVLDLQPNNQNELTPAYAIYEKDVLAKMVLINFMSDPSGANDYTATIFIGGSGFNEANSVPATAKVKYLLAPSVSEKDNVTWAGQTLGGRFEVDGRLKGDVVIDTINCDQTANSCQVKVPAPGVALVFFSDDAQAAASLPNNGEAQTFATTAVTKVVNTATIDPKVLATAQGMSGSDRAKFGEAGTSQGGANAAGAVRASVRGVLAAVVLGAVGGGAVLFGRLAL